MEQEFIRELRNYRYILPKNIIKTLRGQALGGDLEGAKKGLKRIKRKLQGGVYPYENSSGKLKKGKGMEKY